MWRTTIAAPSARGCTIPPFRPRFDQESQRVNDTAGRMAQSALRVEENASRVAAAAEQSLANAQAVAGASEELSASIREIATQVERSKHIVGDAVQAAGNASTMC